MARDRIVLGVAGAGLLAVVAVLAHHVSAELRPDLGPLMISEVLPVEDGGSAGTDAGWVELHNASGTRVDLDGFFLSDDPDDPHRWALPARTIEPGGFLVIDVGGEVELAGAPAAGVRLTQATTMVVLTSPDGVPVDALEPTPGLAGRSYGRDPDDLRRTCVLDRPTPGAPNAPCHDPAEIAAEPPGGPGAPELSEPSGFYDEPFELAITAGEGTVYYTLDGSYPDPDRNPDHTHVYDRPIRIDNRSDEPDRWATIPTIPDQPNGPDGPVQKATVVRARTASGPEAVATYFVGPELRRPDLPVVSIATDGDHLFDHDTGIYVPGAIYEAWETGPDFDPDVARWDRPANYVQRGREWERPFAYDLERSVVLTFCEPTGGCELTQNVGLRIHGGVSRSYRQKSLRVYARNDYGARTIDHPFFGEGAPGIHRRLILRNSGNDWPRTMLLDGYLQGLVSHLEFDTQAYRPAVLFLNGEYWGIHNVRERYDRHYLEITHAVDPDAVVILTTHLEVDTGLIGDDESFRDLLAHLDEHHPADPSTLAHVDEHVDLGNLIDYLILQIFVSNTDWPQGNVDFWRVRVPPGAAPAGPGDGRWRWLVYDLDFAGDNQLDPQHDNLSRLTTPRQNREVDVGIPFLLTRLLENDEFAARFLARFADHLNTTWLPERTLPHLDELEELLAPEIPHHGARWRQHDSVEDWRERVDRLRAFMRERPDIQRQQLVDFFGLPGTVDVRVRTDPAQGHVTVNTIDLTDSTPGVLDPADWSGTYFQGQTITLHANPAAGHRFVRWEGLPAHLVTNAEVELTLDTAADIEAIFGPA